MVWTLRYLSISHHSFPLWILESWTWLLLVLFSILLLFVVLILFWAELTDISSIKQSSILKDYDDACGIASLKITLFDIDPKLLSAQRSICTKLCVLYHIFFWVMIQIFVLRVLGYLFIFLSFIYFFHLCLSHQNGAQPSKPALLALRQRSDFTVMAK